MKYELEYIEVLVKNDVLAEFANPSFDQFNAVVISFREEVERIKLTWKNRVFAAADERSIERYIQDHQKVLIELTNQVLTYLGKDGEVIYADIEGDNYLRIYKTMYQGLEELLSFIEKYFSKYFNQENHIPDSYKWIAHRDCKEHVPGVLALLKSQNPDGKLLSLVFYSLNHFIEHVATIDISYRRLIFLKELLKELAELAIQELEREELNKQLWMLLLYLDYNTPRAFHYATDYVKNIADKEETLGGRVEKLAFTQKCINQTNVKPGFSYNPEFKPLREQLSNWIAEEIYYIEKRQQLSLNFSTAPTDDFLQKDFKLKTEMSVPQAAYLVRILVETGVIQNKNIQDVTRFFSKYLKTKRTDNVSHESFRTKFYNVEDSAKEAVKDVLINLLNQVRKK